VACFCEFSDEPLVSSTTALVMGTVHRVRYNEFKPHVILSSVLFYILSAAKHRSVKKRVFSNLRPLPQKNMSEKYRTIEGIQKKYLNILQRKIVLTPEVLNFSVNSSPTYLRHNQTE
jgi:hypothetical protein